jgi:hypothetical protein
MPDSIATPAKTESNRPEFPHGLQEKRTTRNRRENRAKARILTLKKERRADIRRATGDLT